MADDGSRGVVAATNDGAVATNSHSDLPPTQAAASTDKDGLPPSLQRNLSVTSTHSHSSRSSHRRFPASPALSTLSKNSSSGSSSLGGAARRSVDDILSDPRLSRDARRKRLRSSSGSRERPIGNSSTASAAAKPAAVHSDMAAEHDRVGNMYRSARKAKPPAKRRLQDPTQNEGAEERRRRLERLQREKLRRQQQEGQGQKKKAPSSGLIKLEKMRQEEAEAMLESMGPLKVAEGVPISDQQEAAVDERTNESSHGTDERSDPTPRRSRRAKAVTSYNVAELAKNNIIASPVDDKSGPLEAKSSQSVEHADCDGSKNIAALPLSQEEITELDDEDPDSAEEALAALLTKYEACVGQGSQTDSGDSTISPWDVARLFSAMLSHLNLYDADFVKSQECQQIEKQLGPVLASADQVRYEVMNRDTSEDKVEGNNARLLRMIQIQVWTRMTVWTMERDAGLDFVRRVLALAEKEAGKQKGKTKKNVKKRKKKAKAKSGVHNDDTSPQQSLVDELQALMDLAPYVLPRSLDFSQWLRDTLTLGFREPVPDYGVELFDRFEISIVEPIALRRHGTDASSVRSGRSEKSEVSRSPVKGNNSAGSTEGGSPTKRIMESRNKRQQAYFASLADEEKASSNSNAADDESATITGSLSTVTSTSRASSLREKDDIALFQTSKSLTATVPTKTRNPFLKGSARGEYVGSHMSTKLSNIASLFREVKAAPKPKPKPKRKPRAETKVPATKRKDPPEMAQAARPSVVATAVASSATARQSKPSSAKTRLLAPKETPMKETPMKRLRPAASARAAPLFGVQETPRPIIEETPAGPRVGVRPFIGNAIVAETPQQQSAILPNTLFGSRPRPRPSLGLSHRTSQRPMRGGGHGQQLTPVNEAGTLSFGLSPMPRREDVASAVAEAARAARKRK